MKEGFLEAVLISAVAAILAVCCGCHSSDHSGRAETSVEEPQADWRRGVQTSLPLCRAGAAYEGNVLTHEEVCVLGEDLRGSAAVTLAGGELPPGLEVDAAGVISGTSWGPAGLYAFSVSISPDSNPAVSFVQDLAVRVIVPGVGTQPWETVLRDPRAYFVHQDSAMCGPTAFYMVFKYLGGHLPGAGPINADLTETIPRQDAPVLGKSSKTGAYIGSMPGTYAAGTDWSQLEEAARFLRGGEGAFFPCVQSNPDSTDDDGQGASERELIFEHDLRAFLETDTPVLIHLKRPYPFSGHYLVVIGHDQDTDEVLYLDPNNRQFDPREEGFDPEAADWPQVVRRVLREAFISESWYRPEGSFADARWDGKWLGFIH